MPICAAPARFEHHAVAQQEMGAEEVKAFLSHLATQMNVAASTQNQAFSALLFLYQDVLKKRRLLHQERIRCPVKPVCNRSEVS